MGQALPVRTNELRLLSPMTGVGVSWLSGEKPTGSKRGGEAPGQTQNALKGGGFISSGLLIQGRHGKLPLRPGLGEANPVCVPLREWVSIVPAGEGKRRDQA